MKVYRESSPSLEISYASPASIRRSESSLSLRSVNGHEDLATGGQVFSPLADIRIPHPRSHKATDHSCRAGCSDLQ